MHSSSNTRLVSSNCLATIIQAILQNVTFQDDNDEFAANDTEQFEDDDQEVITR